MDALRFVSDSATAEEANDFFLVVNTTREALETAPDYMAARFAFYDDRLDDILRLPDTSAARDGFAATHAFRHFAGENRPRLRPGYPSGTLDRLTYSTGGGHGPPVPGPRRRCEMPSSTACSMPPAPTR